MSAMRASLFLGAFGLAAGHFLKPRDCAADNCLRAIRNPTRPGSADCASYLLTTVTPATSTVTATVTITSVPTVTVTDYFSATLGEVITTSEFLSTTLGEVATESETVSITVPATVTTTQDVQVSLGETVTTTDVSIVTATDTVVTDQTSDATTGVVTQSTTHVTVQAPTVTVLSPIAVYSYTTSYSLSFSYVQRPEPERRQVTVEPPNIPAYATPCSGTVRYSSACSCLSVLPGTTTAATPLTTTTISVTVTSPVTQIVDTTSTLTSVSTDVVVTTDTLISVSTDVLVSTDTLTTTTTDVVTETLTSISVSTDVVLQTDTATAYTTQTVVDQVIVTSVSTSVLTITDTITPTTTSYYPVTLPYTIIATTTAKAFYLQAQGGPFDQDFAYIVEESSGVPGDSMYQLEFSPSSASTKAEWQISGLTNTELWSYQHSGSALSQYTGGASTVSEVADIEVSAAKSLRAVTCSVNPTSALVSCVSPAGSQYNHWCAGGDNIYLCNSTQQFSMKAVYAF